MPQCVVSGFTCSAEKISEAGEQHTVSTSADPAFELGAHGASMDSLKLHPRMDIGSSYLWRASVGGKMI